MPYRKVSPCPPFYFGGGFVPYSSDLLYLLSGEIITIAGSRYFRDITGNNRHFLITNDDLPVNGFGFPYKSSAVISPPVDAVLQAADVNGYLYTAGVPNQLPVNAFFQDIDYEHINFARHLPQILNASGVEIFEPCVVDICMYNTVKAGAALTTCQAYFGVPAEDMTAKWCSPAIAVPPGNDANPGTKLLPDLTIQHAIDSENTGLRVYFKTNQDFVAAYGRVDDWLKNNKLYALGYCRNLNNYDASNILRINGANVGELINFTFEITDAVLRSVLITSASTLIFNHDRFKLDNGGGVYGEFLHCLNSVFAGSIGNSAIRLRLYAYNLNHVVSGNIFNLTAVGTLSSYDFAMTQNTTPLGNLVYTHNKHIGVRVGAYYCMNIAQTLTGNMLVKDNYYNVTGALGTYIWIWGNRVTSTMTLEICYEKFFVNTAFYKTIEIAEHQINIPYIHHCETYLNTAGSVRGKSYHSGNVLVEYCHTFGENVAITHGDDYDGDVQNGEVLAANLYHTIRYCKIWVNRDAQSHINSGFTTTDADNKIIVEDIGNYIRGFGCYNATIGNADGIITGWQRNGKYRYNFIEGVYNGFNIHGVTNFTTEGILANIIKDCQRGIFISGLTAINIFNNTIISKWNGAYGLYCQIGTSGVVFKNNIVILLGTGNCYGVRTVGGGVDTVDYNLYYCPNGNLRFTEGGIDRTFAQWQALGYDAHSRVLTATEFTNLFINMATDNYALKTSSAAIGAGEKQIALYDDCLDATTNYPKDRPTLISIVTKAQGVVADCGAYVH